MSATIQRSPRAIALQAILDMAKRLPKYFVRRGDADALTHDYTAHPYLAYLMSTEAGLDHNREVTPVVEMKGQLVLAASRPPATGGVTGELDDALIDELSIDATWILREACRSLSAVGALGDIHLSTATMQEFHNVGHTVQGIAVTFLMQF